MEVSSGETLFKEGDRGDYLCFVISGNLEVIKTSKSTNDVIISTIGKGRSIGEMSVIDDYPRSATVKCKTKATLIALSRERFDTLLNEYPLIDVKVMRSITRLLSLNLRKNIRQACRLHDAAALNRRHPHAYSRCAPSDQSGHFTHTHTPRNQR